MKVCVFGAGAIGGYLGVELATAGVDVSLVARGPHLEAMRQHGLKLLIHGQEKVARVPCTDKPAELGVQDYVIIALKSHSIPSALDSMMPLIGPNTSIVTASNGLPYWYFNVADGPLKGVALESVDPGGRQAQMLGAERAIGCVVLPATEVIAPGVIMHESGKKFPLGEPSGKRSDRIDKLHEMLQAGGIEAPIREDIRDEIWLKLWGNCCFNPVGALTGATLDMIASDPGTRAVCRAMMMEFKSIGDVLGLKLRVDVERRIDGAGAVGAHKVSMLQDLERARPMEIEPLVGVIQELGRLTHTPTPTIDTVLALIRQRAYAATRSS